MARKMRSKTDPLLNKIQAKAKEEKERKTRQLGVPYAICKNHGPLTVDKFYLQKRTDQDGNIIWVANKYCKTCMKGRIKSLGEEKRTQYASKTKITCKTLYQTDENYRKNKVERSRETQIYARNNLTDSYVRKKIKDATGIPTDEITIPMIMAKREEIKARRERLKQKKTKV